MFYLKYLANEGFLVIESTPGASWYFGDELAFLTDGERVLQ
jgi:hypothetical protein